MMLDRNPAAHHPRSPRGEGRLAARLRRFEVDGGRLLEHEADGGRLDLRVGGQAPAFPLLDDRQPAGDRQLGEVVAHGAGRLLVILGPAAGGTKDLVSPTDGELERAVRQVRPGCEDQLQFHEPPRLGQRVGEDHTPSSVEDANCVFRRSWTVIPIEGGQGSERSDAG